MKPITSDEALKLNPMVCETYKMEQERIMNEKKEFAIGVVNECIARNIHKLNNGEVITESPEGVMCGFVHHFDLAKLYPEFEISTLGNSIHLCIKKK